MNNSKFTTTTTALICTILFSTTCILSAVGPAQAAGKVNTTTASTSSPVVRLYA